MAKLDNSKRRLHQAVYAPLQLSDGKRARKRGLAKRGFVASMQLTREDLTEVEERLQTKLAEADPEETARLQPVLAALPAVRAVALERGTADVLAGVARVADVDPDALIELGEQVLDVRRVLVEEAVSAHERVSAAQRNRSAEPERRAAGPPPGYESVGQTARELPTAAVYQRSRPHEGAPGTEGVSESFTVAKQERAKPAAERVAASRSATLAQLTDWAMNEGVAGAQELEVLLSAPKRLKLDSQMLMASALPIALQVSLEYQADVLQAFKKQIEIEPVGLLHLERLTFAPDGIERGELVYSVPLAPSEEVNIAHKEWSNTSEEFQKIVTDFLEDYSEEGVAEKSELVQATSSQHQHSSGINTGVSASGGYGPVSITTTLGVNVAASASSSEQFSRNQSIAVTRKASSRSKREHKMTFKVASAAGTEDQTVRKIKNPSADKATRADYYQLIRKWEVNAYRYGLRLTYDITIPEPASDILGKITEIKELSDALEKGFPSSDVPWAQFDLMPDDITRNNYTSKAAEYNAAVPDPPPEYKWFDESAQHQWKTLEEAQRSQFFALQVDVDEDYSIDHVDRDEHHTVYVDENAHFGWQDVDDFQGTSGKRIMVYQAVFLGSLYVELRVRARLRDEVLDAWKLKAWNAIRDAVQAQYYEQRQLLKDRLAKLQEDLGAQDALSLRKMEREEVMKGVLRWLLGPSFEFVPEGMSPDLYGEDEAITSKQAWSTVLAQGELTKFLHHAIEWENVLYFLYPYFWSHTKRWELKKFLEHPDPMHRAFLRSGSARVVLTVRPGFESELMSVLESGALSALPGDHPYLTIIEEMENYAKTNYPGIPPADPEGANSAEEGVLIGTWHEYTPTSAIDIAFGETLPTA